MPAYARPTRLDEALRLLARGEATLVAGGTDYYPGRAGAPLADDILDLSAIASLRGIGEHPDHWRIGATTTWSDLREADLPPLFDALRQAAREIGGIQIQNRGTIAGNLCNASPAADGVPPLLALDAQLEIAGAGGVRRTALEQFLVANRRTALAPGEIATAVIVPKPRRAARSRFLKLGARRYLVISIVMAAAKIELDGGKVRAARVAVGACSPVARRLPALEAALEGRSADAALGEIAEAAHLRPLEPIDDVRADRDYRSDAALTLVRRALNQLGAMP